MHEELATTPVSKRKRWILVTLAGMLLLGLGWFNYSSHPKVMGLRNILHYQIVKRFGGPTVRLDDPPGSITGIIHDIKGEPVANAIVLVASRLGHTYTAQSGSDGQYQINGLPPGRYVPVAGKRGYEDALEQTCFAGLCFKSTVRVRSDQQAQGVDLTLSQAEPLEVFVDDSLIVSDTVEVKVNAPLPGSSRRTHFSFERTGLRVNDCYLYEPLTGEGPFPTLLLVLPGPVLGWEIVPVPFAAEGYSVLAFYPLRGADIDEDAADILTALEYLRQGLLPSVADPEHLVLVGASFTSLHTYRLLGLTEEIDVTLVLGGMADGFAFRHDVEMGTAHTRPPFDQMLMALGFPNNSPELYFEYSAIYHVEGLPPVCLLHGRDDELVPFEQSVLLDAELTRLDHPHEFYAYNGLKHYFATSADSATTQQMFQDSLDCLARALADE